MSESSSTPIRIFLLGTPRSGTTLLQAMLASHPNVMSLPETHYFKKIWGRLWALRVFGVVSPRAAAQCLDRLVDEVQPRTVRPGVARWWPGFRAYGRAFGHVLDASCVSAAKRAWVDKSPVHLHCLKNITRMMPDAQFIHLLRDGRDVTASFLERCLTDPERWIPQVTGGDWRSYARNEGDNRLLAAIVARWNTDVDITLSKRGCRGHHVVRYDELVHDPGRVLRRLCERVSIEYSDSMLRYMDSASLVLGARAGFDHMLGVRDPLHDTTGIKWETLLTDEQRRFASSHLRGGGRVDDLLPLSVAI